MIYFDWFRDKGEIKKNLAKGESKNVREEHCYPPGETTKHGDVNKQEQLEI